MKRLMYRLIPILLLVSVISLSPTLYAEPHWNGSMGEITTGDMVVRFVDMKPVYWVWIPNENDTAIYVIQFNRIIEFKDVDGDGKYNGTLDELLAQALLTAHDNWQVYAETINHSGIIEIRVTFTALVDVYQYKQTGPGAPISKANVTFVNHIYSNDTEVEGIPIEGNRELKIDIIISDWPWSDNTSSLLLNP